MPDSKLDLKAALKAAIESERRKLRDILALTEYIRLIAHAMDEGVQYESLPWLNWLLDRINAKYEPWTASLRAVKEEFANDFNIDLVLHDDGLVLMMATFRLITRGQAGAKVTWDASKYDALWHDIGFIADNYPEVLTEGGQVIAARCAKKLLEHFPAKYKSASYKASARKDIDNLSDRIADALNPDLSLNPNLAIIDYDHVVRGDPGLWPGCAAGLEQQKPFRRWSAEWHEALEYENKILSRTNAMLGAIGIYETKLARIGKWRAARKLARAHIWKKLSDQTKD